MNWKRELFPRVFKARQTFLAFNACDKGSLPMARMACCVLASSWSFGTPCLASSADNDCASVFPGPEPQATGHLQHWFWYKAWTKEAFMLACMSRSSCNDSGIGARTIKLPSVPNRQPIYLKSTPGCKYPCHSFKWCPPN